MSDEMIDGFAELAPLPGMTTNTNLTTNCPNGQMYTVKSGDTMFLIARRFNISLQSLINANPQIADPNKIFPGQMICVPVPGPAPGPSPTHCPSGTSYTIKSGDTMYEIARRHNISLAALIAANPQISDPNRIFPGQVICIPGSGGSGGFGCPGGRVYRVVSGDTLYLIAQRSGVTLDALIRANPQIKNPDLIFPGQEICIPAGTSPIPCPNGTLYTVKSGDTMFEIARRNNITLAALIAANPQIADPNRIFPGQVVCIPVAAVPMPLPAPIPMPMPMPMPMPTPTPTPMPMPLPTPMPMPTPCPGGIVSGEPAPSMYPCPVYVVVPWEQCPFRGQKKKKHKKHDCKRSCR